MNRLTLLIVGTAFVASTFMLGRCSVNTASDAPASNPGTLATNATPPSITPAQAQAWTCAMHPQIQQSTAGQCPICGMDLIPTHNPLTADGAPLAANNHNNGRHTLSLSENARALADIQTSPVERRFPEAKVRLVGKLDYDETLIKSLSARFPMRIDELFVSFVGVPVKQGQHLARIYSPELRSAQSELISAAKRYDSNSTLVKSAKEKLRLWGLLPDQINAIIKRGTALDEFELKAPISGVVTQKNVNTGDYLQTGQSLFTIVDMHNLWLRLEAYESDLAWLRLGQAVSFSVEAYPGESFEGKITFINPEIDRKTRTVSIRVNVPNEHQKLKPGMFSKAIVRSQIALAGKVYSPELMGKWISPMHPEIIKDSAGQCDICGMDLVPVEQLGYLANIDHNAPLVVPASAVLRTGKRAVVYVQINASSGLSFEGREINLGPRAGDVFIVNSGLSEGERVVTHGAFKIDSALQIQAKPSMMNPSKHHHGHNHSHAVPPQSNPLHVNPAHKGQLDAAMLDAQTMQHLMPLYFALQTALATDDLPDAKQQLAAMLPISQALPLLYQLIEKMQHSRTLDQIRLPHFETLSHYLLQGVNLHNQHFNYPIYQMYCPMAHPDRGANWLQKTPALQNPYFGEAMLKCGETKAQLTIGNDPTGNADE